MADDRDISTAFPIKETLEPEDSNAIVTNSFWDNWYAQIGGDMILLFPVKHKVKDVFPNGKSLGVSVAVGKWFSPIFGGKFKANWNNVIIRETHNVWYKPYGEPGGNHDEGGFMTFSGDIMLNMHNLIGDYKPVRKWNLSAGVRAGGWLNVKEGKGGPILGVGLNNTYRLSDRWKLFADVNYTFLPSMNGVDSGTDHGGNSYAELNIGVEMSLSKNNTFHRVSEKNVKHNDKATLVNTFWDNFFVQAGIGMSLQNPYGTNFANVFPNGHTFGINLGLGKWFTPEIGVRGGLNWQNGIIRNSDASYLASNPKLNRCEECAAILHLGQSKEARKVEYQLGAMGGDSLDEVDDDDIEGPDICKRVVPIGYRNYPCLC